MRTLLFTVNYLADNFSENEDASKSKFERVVLSYLTLCTNDNIGP